LFNPAYLKDDVLMQLLKDTSLMGGAMMIAGIYKEEKSTDQNTQN
jgi:hypothetical protein